MHSRNVDSPVPAQPSTQHVTHVYNTGDPIPMGTCTGVSSSCALAGLALESRCHLGRVIRYDAISKLGWSANIVHHGIQALIDGILAKEDLDWGEEGAPRSVPAFSSEEDCVVSSGVFLCLVRGAECARMAGLLQLGVRGLSERIRDGLRGSRFRSLNGFFTHDFRLTTFDEYC